MNVLIIGSEKPGKAITTYTENHIGKIKKVLPDSKITVTESTSEIGKITPMAEIVIMAPNSISLLDLKNTPNLKWIHFTSAGVTDISKLLLSTNIILTNSSGVHPIPISEHVFGILLMFARCLTESYKVQIEKKTWQRDLDLLKVFELNGKTLGIVGFGRIGSQIAKLAKGFNMKVVTLEHRRKIPRGTVDGVYKNIDELLQNADFVIDCLPLTPQTKSYFDMKKLKKMSRGAGSASGGKPSSYFINIGRGGTVNEKDLIDALKKNIIAGAGLDVFENEPLPDNSPLWNLPNVILTPHYSGWTPFYTDRVVEIFCTNFKQYLDHKPMSNLVDKQKGY